MDNLGYIINRHFALIAVDTIYNDKNDGIQLKIPNAKKVFKLNDLNLISIIGDQIKSSDVKNYTLKLKSLVHAKNFESTIEDLKDIFNTDNGNNIEGMKEVMALLPDSHEIDLNLLFAKLQSKPELINLVKDVLNQLQNDRPLTTQIMVFSWDESMHSCRLSHLVYVRNNLNGNEDLILAKDFIYSKFSTAKLKNPISQEDEKNMLNSIQLEDGWDSDLNSIFVIIEKAKQILTDGMRKLNYYDTTPNIVFYELSHRTNFKFTIPDMHLIEISYSRNDEKVSDQSNLN